MVMKYINFSKWILILASLFFLHLTSAIASDQQLVADTLVTFHVA